MRAPLLSGDESAPPSSSSPSSSSGAAAFDSADFDPPDSVIFRRARRALPTWRAAACLWLLLAATGALLGLLASLLTYASRSLQAVKLDVLAAATARELAGAVPAGASFAAYLAISLGYGALAALPTAFVAPSAAGSGIPEVKCVLNGVLMPGVLSLRTLFVKLGGLIFAVSSGLPVGKEGPMIQTGAIIAALLATGRLPAQCGRGCKIRNAGSGGGSFGVGSGGAGGASLSLYDELRHDRERRDMVVCGAAAGVAAAFGAPVGGVLFAIEEGASFWFKKLTWRSFFCAVVAAFTVEYFLSGLGVPGTSAGSWGTLGTPGMFSFGDFTTEAGGWKMW
jgi:H+/Cl- antiporter ClcA